MANVDRPNGARPVSTMSGSPWCGYLRLYEVDASAGSIFPGDFVIMEADGKVAPATAGNTELVGVCVGALEHMPNKVGGVTANFMSTGALDFLKYHATGSAGLVLVVVGPDVLYEMQEDDVDGTTLAVTDIGANCDILATAGDTTSGTSRQEIDRSTVVATAAQLRLVDVVDRPDNELAANSRWVVRINESHFTKTAGI